MFTFSQEADKKDFVGALSKLRTEILTRNKKYSEEYNAIVTLVLHSKIEKEIKIDFLKTLEDLFFEEGKEYEPFLLFKFNISIIQQDSLVKAENFITRHKDLTINLASIQLRLGELTKI